MSSKNTYRMKSFKPNKGMIFVSDLERGEKLSRGGLIVLDDNGKEGGIHARWGRVHSFGPDIDYLTVGEWILIDHGRWTFGIDFDFPEGEIRLWQVEPKAIFCATDEDPRGKCEMVRVLDN